MAAFSTGQTGDLEMTLILSFVQEELVRSAKLRPTVMDLSAQAQKGVKQIEVPRYDSHFADPSAQVDDGAVTAETVNFTTDSIPLSDWKTLAYQVGDRVALQARPDMLAELAGSAGRTMGKYLDDKIIEQLRLASASAPDHRLQLSGTDQAANPNEAITLADITCAREALNKADVREDNRWLLVSPKQEKEMLNISNFIKADEYGAREALIDGEIGRIFGFRVMVHNGLSDNEAIAYHKDAVAIAVQKEVTFETERNVLRQDTSYAFSMLAGYSVLEQGVKQVLLNATGT